MKALSRHMTAHNCCKAIVLIVILLFGIDGKTQISKQILSDCYMNNSSTELLIFFQNSHENLIEIHSDINNDTLKIVSELFDQLVSETQKDSTLNYFFLQNYYPRIEIGKVKLPISRTFVSNIGYDKLKPIVNDSQSISAILSFIGTNPYDKNPLVKEYLRDKDEMKKSKIKKAKKALQITIKEMEEYENRTKFIGQFLILPATWGKLDRSLVKYEINSVKFNHEMTQARVKYDFTYRGGSITFDLINGIWTKQSNGTEWIH